MADPKSRVPVVSAGARATAEILEWLELPTTVGRDSGPPRVPSVSAERGWALSGGQAMTAFSGHPPGDVAARLAALAAVLESVTRSSAREVSIAGAELLGEREALCTVRHAPSPGRTLRGNGWMVRALDGWIALTISRPADEQLFAALSEGAVAEGDRQALSDWARHRPRAEVLERSHLLGLAAAPVQRPTAGRPRVRPWSAVEAGRLEVSPHRRPVVADLSSLWAGPLAASLLGAAGAEVMRIESESRPAAVDATDARFFQLLNGSKEHVVLDFAEQNRLNAVLADADIVVLSARPRAITQLGLRRRPGQLWIVITGYGSDPENAHRIGFGDDAAAEAGAVFWHEGTPNFCADALADPVTGLLAAVVASGFLARGVAARVDISLRDAVRWAISDPDRPRGPGLLAAAPTARGA